MGIANQFGAMHLSASSSYEVQRTNNFEVQIGGMDQEFTLAVESVDLPNESNEPIEIPYGNTKVKVAGSTAWDSSNLVVRDFVTADIEKKIVDWRKAVYNVETDQIGWCVNYKKQGTLFQYAPDGTCIRTWTLLGMWPSNVTFGSLSNADNNVKTISMTIAFDKAVPNRDDYQQPTFA